MPVHVLGTIKVFDCREGVYNVDVTILFGEQVNIQWYQAGSHTRDSTFFPLGGWSLMRFPMATPLGLITFGTMPTVGYRQ